MKIAQAIFLLCCFLPLDLGYYVAGRAISPFTAVSIIKNHDSNLPEAKFHGSLKIVTYNICHGWGGDKNKFKMDQQAIIKRLDEISAMLADEKPDIAVLEEVDFDSLLTGRMNQAKRIAEKAGYPYRVEHKNIDARTLFSFSEQNGNVLLSRHPVCEASLVSFPGHKKWETIMGGKSTAVLCDIEISSGKRIRVLATHLASFSEEVRVKSAKIIEMTRKASELPFLVVGDLNSAPAGIPYHNVYNGENAMDILLAGGGFITLPLKAPKPSDFTISADSPSAIVDWILVPPSWNITARRVPKLMASDHFPVVMEMELK